jgi:hypothetical protein
MALLRKLAAKQKADREKLEARLAKQREIGRQKGEHVQQSGLDDLPPEIAVAVEERASHPAAHSEPVQDDDTVANLVARLEAIRERIWRLRAVFAVSLSHDCAVEADCYLQLFQTLAVQLKSKDPSALDQLVNGHESLLLSPPVLITRSIPLETQRWCEIKWEASLCPTPRLPKRGAESVPDGLGWML